MNDTIYRQMAIEAVNSHRYVYENKHLNDYEQGWNDACDYCADEWLDDLPSAQPEQNNLMADVHKRLINETGCKAVCRNEQWWGRGSNDDSDAYNRGFQDGANYAMERIENHIDELLRRKK